QRRAVPVRTRPRSGSGIGKPELGFERQLWRERLTVAEVDELAAHRGHTRPGDDDTHQVQRIARRKSDALAGERLRAHPPQQIDRFGQRVLLADEPRHEAPPADLAARFEAPERPEHVAPGYAERFAHDEIAKHHAVA